MYTKTMIIAAVASMLAAAQAYTANAFVSHSDCGGNPETYRVFTSGANECINTGGTGGQCALFHNYGQDGPHPCTNDDAFASNAINLEATDVTTQSKPACCDTFSQANCVAPVGSNHCDGFAAERVSLSGSAFHSYRCYPC